MEGGREGGGGGERREGEREEGGREGVREKELVKCKRNYISQHL